MNKFDKIAERYIFHMDKFAATNDNKNWIVMQAIMDKALADKCEGEVIAAVKRLTDQRIEEWKSNA